MDIFLNCSQVLGPYLYFLPAAVLCLTSEEGLIWHTVHLPGDTPSILVEKAGSRSQGGSSRNICSGKRGAGAQLRATSDLVPDPRVVPPTSRGVSLFSQTFLETAW